MQIECLLLRRQQLASSLVASSCSLSGLPAAGKTYPGLPTGVRQQFPAKHSRCNFSLVSLSKVIICHDSLETIFKHGWRHEREKKAPLLFSRTGSGSPCASRPAGTSRAIDDPPAQRYVPPMHARQQIFSWPCAASSASVMLRAASQAATLSRCSSRIAPFASRTRAPCVWPRTRLGHIPSQLRTPLREQRSEQATVRRPAAGATESPAGRPSENGGSAR